MVIAGTKITNLLSDLTMSAIIALEEDIPTLEETPAPAVVPAVPAVPAVAMPGTRADVLEDSPPSVVAATPPEVFASNEIRSEFRPAAVPRRSSSSSSAASRGRARSARPRVHDRARDETGRQERRLHKETKLIAQLQGAVDIAARHFNDYTTVVSREARKGRSQDFRDPAAAGTGCSQGGSEEEGNWLIYFISQKGGSLDNSDHSHRSM